MCNALIDTGAMRSCMSKKYYKKLHLVKIHLLQNINVKSATGSNLAPVGLVNYTFELGYGMSIYAMDRVNGTIYSKFDVGYRMISEKATVKPQFRPTSLEDEYTVM